MVTDAPFRLCHACGHGYRGGEKCPRCYSAKTSVIDPEWVKVFAGKGGDFKAGAERRK